MEYCLYHNTCEALSADIESLLDLLLQPLKWRKLELFEDVLTTLQNLIVNKAGIYPYVMETVQSTLRYLSDVSDCSKEDCVSRSSLYDLLTIRRRALSLAHVIYQMGQAFRVPDVMPWKAIADDPNEFADTRNRWS